MKPDSYTKNLTPSLPIIQARRSEALAPPGPSEAARRLFAASGSIRDTLTQAWLCQRGIALPSDISALRFHPQCFYRTPSGRQKWPALIAAVTDGNGNVTGMHRTFLASFGLDPLAVGKAPVDQPRRALGHLAGNGIRFGPVSDTMAAAEGLETALALRMIIPKMPVIAALSAAHLTALIWPPKLHRLYVARDNDDSGRFALEKLRSRATGIDIRELVPRAEDFNADLLTLGPDRLRDWIGAQLASDDNHFLIHDGRQCA